MFLKSKKWIAVLAAAMLGMSMTACGDSDSESREHNTDDASSVTAEVEETAANDAAEDAVEESVEVDVAEEDSVEEVETETSFPAVAAESGNVMGATYSYDHEYVPLSEIKRTDVKTITFLNTLANMPSNAWDVSEAQDGSVMIWVEENGSMYDIYVAGEGGIDANETCSSLFEGYENVESIEFNNCLYTGNVTSFYCMFSGCSSLQSLDISSFDTSNATEMTYMFRYCSALTSLDLSNFETSNVTDFHYMFYYCSALQSLDISSFDTSSATTMSNMFGACPALTSLDLSSFDTSNVTNFGSMFYECSALTSLDLSSFDTSNVTDMSGMFYGCTSLTTIEIPTNCDISNVTDMAKMFYNCSSLEELDTGDIEIPEGTDTTDMFKGTSFE
ncbi:MAG: DUF285 domain-containing protein [Ruminococcus sp.]|nr:DUF285 domain-containing protein [Ruminococcus sp.]